MTKVGRYVGGLKGRIGRIWTQAVDIEWNGIPGNRIGVETAPSPDI